MKKVLFSCVFLFVLNSVNAQKTSLLSSSKKTTKETMNVEKYLERMSMIDIEQKVNQTVTSNKIAAAGSVPLGEAANIWTAWNSRVQSLTANTDLNTVVFIHRQNPASFDGPSSWYRLDVSRDGGDSFSIDNGPINENTPGENIPNGQARYPNCAIYAPDSDPENAIVTYLGATHDGVSAVIWDGFTAGSSKLDGSNATQSDYLDESGYIPYSLVNGLPGEFWSGTRLIDDATNLFTKAVKYKGTWNGNGIDWEESELIGNYAKFENGNNVAGSNPEVAFSDDGQIGYYFLAGATAPDDENKVYKPLFWMTEDGGENWNGPHTMNLDKIGGYADTFKYINNAGIEGPLTLTTRGYDVVVDKYGNAHLGTMLQSKFYSSDDQDFTDYSWSGGGNFIVDLIYDRAANNWSMVFPDLDNAGLSQLQTYTDTIFYDEGVESDNRLQMSKDPSGEKIFILYGDSDPVLSAGEESHRDLIGWGYDIETGKTTDVRNLTSDNEEWYGEANFFNISNHSFFNNDVYQIPAVFAEITDPNNNLSPVQFHYYQDATFEPGDFAFDPAVPSTGAEFYSGVLPVLGEIEKSEITQFDFVFNLPGADPSSVFDNEVTWYFGDGSAPEVSNINTSIGHAFPEGVFTVKVCGDNSDGFVCSTTTIATVDDEEAPSIEVIYNGTTYVDGDEITVTGGDLAEILMVVVSDDIDPNPSVEIDGGGYDPAMPGSYDVTITSSDASGNTTAITVTVIIVDEEVPSISVSDGTNTFEDGATVTIEGDLDISLEDVLTISATDNSGDVTLDYDASEVDFTTVGDYDLVITATDASGNATTSTITISVVDTSNPVLDVLAFNEVTDYDCGNQTFNPAPDDYASLLTFTDNLIDPNANTNLDNYVEVSENIGTDNGTYSVEYTATDDAGNVSDPITIDFIINCPTGIEDIALAAAVSVSPNPSEGVFLLNIADSYGQVKVKILDIQGKEIYTANKMSGATEIDLGEVAAGVYFIQVKTKEAQTVKSIVIK